MMEPDAIGVALRMESVSKRFPGTLAVDNVDLEVRVGEVHALMGENGAGKSTLMRILTGAYGDYTGRVLVSGKEVQLRSPAAAIAHGIGMVYQELSLARPISIAENILAGRLPTTKWGLLDKKALVRETRRCLAHVGLDLDPLKTIDGISPHEAQLVEIAKVLSHRPCILILDEPTSALSREEVRRLFDIVRDLKRRGLSIVYISHHLPEVMEIADRVTVLRDGRRIATRDMTEVTPQSLVQMMVGQTVDEFYSQRTPSPGETVLRVERLTRLGFFHDVSFEVRSGEILGLAGLSGAGRTELARSLCGLDPLDFGVATLNGGVLERGDYPAAVSRGLVYLTEDRKEDGLFLRLSVGLNLAAAVRRVDREGSLVQKYLKELGIVAASPGVDAGTLSGGNQQKVLLGKWLATQPRVLILDEPTRGVDINAKRRIHGAVMALADRGTAILLASSDLPELVGLADRVVVLRHGRLAGEIGRESLSEEAVLLAAYGQGAPAHA